MPKIGKITSDFLKWLRFFMVSLGVVILVAIVFAFTSLPFWAQYNLGASKAYIPNNVETIVMLGASGFPSGAVLERLWYTAELSQQFPNAKVVISTPGDSTDMSSTVCESRQFLMLLGVGQNRILLETEGLNTRYQAISLYKMFEAGRIQEPLVVVTSTTHVYRSVCSFEKAGFTKVSGKPASAEVLETDLTIEGDELGGNQIVPNIGGSLFMRYKFWDYLQYELIVLREYTAIAYYKIKGWI